MAARGPRPLGGRESVCYHNRFPMIIGLVRVLLRGHDEPTCYTFGTGASAARDTHPLSHPLPTNIGACGVCGNALYSHSSLYRSGARPPGATYKRYTIHMNARTPDAQRRAAPSIPPPVRARWNKGVAK